MSVINISEILQLNIQDRIKLIEDIWETIAEIPDAIPLTDEQKSEIDIRLELYRQKPDDTIPWSVVREKIKNLK